VPPIESPTSPALVPDGWFVVGAGRNGMEYSARLLVCLGATAWAYAPQLRKA